MIPLLFVLEERTRPAGAPDAPAPALSTCSADRLTSIVIPLGLGAVGLSGLVTGYLKMYTGGSAELITMNETGVEVHSPMAAF